MTSDIIKIDNQGNGFEQAVLLTERIGEFQGLTRKETVQLKMITEEMLSLARSVTGEMQASFWLECAGKAFDMHMTTEAVLDKEKRFLLISSSSSRKNEISKTFLGRLRDAFEQAMTADADKTCFELPDDVAADLSNRYIEDQEWDGYERSVLRGLADNVKIAIKGGLVSMTVSKKFA